MFRTIFSRLVAIFLLILIIGFTITGILLYYFLGDFVSDEKADALIEAGESISSYLSVYIEYEGNPIARLYLSKILQLYSSNTSSLIFIVNKDGFIVESGPEIGRIQNDILRNLRNESGNLQLPNIQQHKEILLSQRISREVGDFNGLFKDTGFQWLTVKIPFRYSISNYSEDITGVVYMHTPLPEVQRARYLLFRFFIISVAVSIIISVFLVYIFSLRLSKPLKEINKAAKVIAGGEFKQRLNIKSQDEIGELAESFNQMVNALENLEEMRRGFIANVSHELRTPMTSIRGFIEGILDGTIPPEKHNEYLSIVRDETSRLNRLVNNLLDLARMEAGEVTLVFREFDINELIRRSIIKLESLIVEKGIEIQVNFEDEELYVKADIDSIERVVYNLLHNAIKFTPEKGKIEICAWYQKDKAFVSVEDSGVGIPKHEINLIWERFHKSDRSRSRDKSGTGLGLAITRNIINDHKQSIWVESEYGKGAKFTFTLEKA
ncbi:MAG: sensor histidine kinase [Acetivibrionales bacterium]|jgi:signal transduction histidine kinase